MTARTAFRRRRRPVEAGARLPWWALLLPALAFVVLLGLHVSGGPENLPEGHHALSRYAVADIVERVGELLPG